MKEVSLKKEFNFSSTFQHPLALKGLVELLPTAWVRGIANPLAGEVSNIAFGNDRLVDLETLWNDIKNNGLRDPFTLSAGRFQRNCRLEAGNHRIKIFAEYNVEYIPAVVLVGDDARINEGNGDHQFYKPLLIPEQSFNRLHLEERINMRPTDVFQELKELKNAGVLPPVPQSI